MKPSGNTILITGGGSGIGEALAHRLHDAGNRVIIAGRRREALEKSAEGREGISVMQLDIEDPQAIRDFAQRVVADHPELNVLINNAGIMRFEGLDTRRELDDAEATITTNLLGPIRLIDALIDHLVTQSEPAIVNVTSGLAFVPLMRAPTYSATKAAMHSYSLSLRQALKGKVDVIELAPPAVQTTLTPGQESREGYQPLEDFADEAFGLLMQQPTPNEVLVKNVQGFRHAEAQGKTDELVEMLASHG
jgi:uncharacterized oxidoreductase